MHRFNQTALANWSKYVGLLNASKRLWAISGFRIGSGQRPGQTRNSFDRHAYAAIKNNMTPEPVIHTTHLSKSFGRLDVVCDLNLSIEPGRITGFLGANGSGKSTTIKMLLGMLKPSCGSGSVLGRRIDDKDESIDLRRLIAYVGEDKRLYAYMTVKQIIRFTRSFYSDWRTEVEQNLLRRFELPPDRMIRALSKGMRTKLALLLALSRRPSLLILDEPSDGLDPCAVEILLESLKEQSSEGTSIFFSSHQIAEVERIANNVCIIDKGRLLLAASVDELRRSYQQITLFFNDLPAESEFQLPGVKCLRTTGLKMVLFISGNPQTVVERARDFNATSVDVSPLALRDIYLQTVGND